MDKDNDALHLKRRIEVVDQMKFMHTVIFDRSLTSGWDQNPKPLSPFLFSCSIHLWGIRAWFSHVPFSVLQYLKETWRQKLLILSGWVGSQLGPKQLGWFFWKAANREIGPNTFFGGLTCNTIGKLDRILFLGGLTCNSTRRSCRPGHFIMSTPPLPLGSDNPMTAAFISIFQPLLYKVPPGIL